MEHNAHISYDGVLNASSASISSANMIHAISAGSTMATSGTVVLSNSNNVTFGMNGNTITVSATRGTLPAVSVYPDAIPGHGWIGWLGQAFVSGTTASTGGSTQITASGWVYPMPPQAFDVNYNVVRFPCLFRGQTGLTASLTEAFLYGLYTKNVNTLSLVSSYLFNNRRSNNGVNSATIRWWWGTDSAANSTSSTFSASSDISNCFSFTRWAPLSVGAGTLTPSVYYLGHLYWRRSTGNNALVALSIFNKATKVSASWPMLKFGSGSGTTHWLNSMHGAFSTTTNVSVLTMNMPSSIHSSAISASSLRAPFAQWISTVA